MKEIKEAKKIAFKLLEQKPRTIKEIEEKLKIKNFEIEIIDLVINDLKKDGYLNDTNFVKIWVENRLIFKPRAKCLLKQELLAKNISEEIIDKELEKISDKDEYNIAYNLAQQKFLQYKDFNLTKARQKTYNFLLTRGFYYQIAKEICLDLK